MKTFTKNLFPNLLFGLVFLTSLSPFGNAGTEVDGRPLDMLTIQLVKETVRNLGFKVLPFSKSTYRRVPEFKSKHPEVFQSFILKGVEWNQQEYAPNVSDCNEPDRLVLVKDLANGDFPYNYEKTSRKPRVWLCGALVTKLQHIAKMGKNRSEIRGFAAQAIVSEIFHYVQGNTGDPTLDEVAKDVICESEHSEIYSDFCSYP